MPIQNKDTLAASVPTPPLGSTTLFTDAGLLKTKDDTGSVIILTAGGTVTSVAANGTQGINIAGSPITSSGTITVGLDNITPITVSTGDVTIAGNLTFTGNSRLITGDFTNAIEANRTLVQTSTLNGSSILSIVPNGTGAIAAINVDNDSVIGNNSYGGLLISPTGFDAAPAVLLRSSVRGTGTHLPLSIQTGVGGLNGALFDINGNVVIGGIGALVTTATDRFLYINSMAGTPSGIPTIPTGFTAAGKVPITVDTTNNKLYFYSNSAWHDSTSGTGVTSVFGTAPIASSGGTAPAISISQADTTTDGYLSAIDWNTFNNKGSGTVTNVSVVTANGVSGIVATPTTTPAITLTLGAITPSSVAAVGTVSGSNLSGTNTGDQTITLTGDVTGSGTSSFVTALSTTGVTAATYGSATQVPVFVVDSKGRITSVTDTPISVGTVTNVSVVTANGVSGIVATPTTTPAITLTLGAITPSSVASTGDISVETAGNGLKIKEGANAKMGVATLVAGSVVVSTTAVTVNSRIFLTSQNLGTISMPASLAVSARTPATSFTILSSAPTDTSDIAWMIVEPA